MMVIPRLGLGGAEHSFYKVYSSLRSEYDVRIVLFNRQESVFFAIEDRGIRSLEVNASGNMPGKVRAFIRRIKRLRKEVKDFQPDAVISYLEGANYLVSMLPSNYYRIISQRGSIFHDETIGGILGHLRRRLLIPMLYRRADRIVALNDGIAEEIKALLKKHNRIHVIPNMFNRKEIIHLSGGLPGNHSGRNRLCVVGRLAREKGVHHLLYVLRKLNSNGSAKFSLHIIGDGDQLEPLTHLAEKLALSWKYDPQDLMSSDLEDIVFTGRMENPYVHIANADALLIGSSSEGGPNVLIESMICKTLVISANCPSGPQLRIVPGREIPYSSREPLFAENGMLLPNFQHDDTDNIYDIWANAIIEIFRTPDKKMQMVESAFHYSELFSTERITEEWKKVIER